MSNTTPYTGLARHYRQVMAHVDYARWGNFLLKVLQQQERYPVSMLELGAGNAILSRHFIPPTLKLRVTSDLSWDMLADAQPATAGLCVVADARNLPFRGSFDLILMTYDAINYLDTRGIRDLFKRARSLLTPKGCFIFDVTTERNSLRYFEDVTDAIDVDNGLLVRRSWYESEERIQYNRFDLFEKNRRENYRRIEELHTQYIYESSELEEMARSAKLRVCARYGNFTMQSPSATADRIHFVLEKA